MSGIQPVGDCGRALLDKTTGRKGAELDPVIPTLFPKDDPVSGVATQQRGVAPAEEERMEFWKEGAGGGKVKLHAGFLALTHRNNRPLVPGAAEEGGRDGAARRSRSYVLERGGRRFPPRDQRSVECRGRRGKAEATEKWEAKKMDTASLGVTPAMERMAASILVSKSRKAGRLITSSETRAKKPTRVETH